MLSTCGSVQAFDCSPWMDEPWHVSVNADLGVEFYPNVAGGYNPPGYDSINALALFGAKVPLLKEWELAVEFLLERTSRYNFNFQNAALQVRKLFFNDIAGDMVSLDVSGSIRIMPDWWTKDVSIPYHNIANFEIATSIGKEFCRNDNWFLRVFAWVAFGQANKGVPWFRTNATLITQITKDFLLSLECIGYFGLGNEYTVNVDNFASYANIHHESIDAAITFAYASPTMGTFTFLYDRRFYAVAFPEELNRFEIRWNYPLGI